jgi:DNA-binding SARP family transcriptional activator
VDFGVLGPVEARRAGEVLPVGSGRERFVLAMLLLNADRVVAADRLVDAMWEVPPSSARAQLHNMLSNLRRRLGVEGLIATRPVGYELLLGCHQLDLERFRRLVERGRELAAAGEYGPAAATLSEAAALWRGPALADVPDELVGGLREALHDERLAAAEAQLDAELALSRHDAVLQALAALLSDHPYRERLYEVQMVALVGSGRRADALAVYQRVYRRFVADLGVEPGYALRGLEQRILRGEVVGPDRPRSLLVPRELPVAAALTGRDKLTGAVSDALRRLGDSGPVVAVLVGPGGVGKTAVAIACAHELAEAFPDGQLHADLRGSHERPADSHAVVGRFLRTLGVDGASLPDDGEERVAMYRSRLADTRTLVVLDDAECEAQVRPLVPGGSGCAALVTSRRQLGALVGAKRWMVPVLEATDAVELLVRIVGPERVTTASEAATEIVESCGRLPLAVCIAAARLAARPDWTVDELRRRLAEEHGRLDQLSVGDLDVRASIALSYRTLDPLPRKLFGRLGRTGFPDWPDWVADTLLDQPAERLLDQLTDAHLIEPIGHDAVGQRRFRLHDLVATFARERALAEDPPQQWTEAQTRLLSTWLSLATVADEQIPHDLVRAPAMDTTPPPATATQFVRSTPSGWFEAERRCLLVAIDQACQLDPPDLAGTLALRVAGFLSLRGYHDDWDRTVRQALCRVVEPQAGLLRARLLGSLCIACQRSDRYPELTAAAAEELAVARRVGDREEEVRALTHIGLAALMTGRYDEAIDRLEQALTEAHRPDVSDRLLHDTLRYLAFANMTTGHAGCAVPLIEEALSLGRAMRYTTRTALHLYHYGMALGEAGRPEEAEAPLAEAIHTCHELGDDCHAAYAEQALADIDIRRSRHAVAAERLERARQVHAKRGEGDGLAETVRSTGDLAAAQGNWPTAITLLHRALDIWRTIESHIEVARTLARLHRAHTALDQHDTAAACRREYQSLLARLNLDDACLYLPPHYLS